jgi:hypothetical protein
MLHLLQPKEPGTEELGRARPNGVVTYLGANEVSKVSISVSFPVSLSFGVCVCLSRKDT